MHHAQGYAQNELRAGLRSECTARRATLRTDCAQGYALNAPRAGLRSEQIARRVTLRTHHAHDCRGTHHAQEHAQNASRSDALHCAQTMLGTHRAQGHAQDVSRAGFAQNSFLAGVVSLEASYAYSRQRTMRRLSRRSTRYTGTHHVTWPVHVTKPCTNFIRLLGNGYHIFTNSALHPFKQFFLLREKFSI